MSWEKIIKRNNTDEIIELMFEHDYISADQLISQIEHENAESLGYKVWLEDHLTSITMMFNDPRGNNGNKLNRLYGEIKRLEPSIVAQFERNL